MTRERIRILAVDDDRTFLDDLSHLLRRDYALECVSNAEAAMAAVRATSFDAVLLDLDLGRGTDGFELLDSLRRTRPGLPVIMVTKDSSSASPASIRSGTSGPSRRSC